MLKAIIIDDEQHCIDRLQLLLGNHSETIQVLGSYSSVEVGKKEIDRLKPDVVFLDIQLNEDTGFDLLSQFERIDFEVIFTTAFDNYAIQAFKFSALDYLLKPIAEDDLEQAVKKLIKQTGLRDTSQRIETLFHNFKREIGHSKKLAIPTMEGLVMVDVDKIIRLQSDVNYTHIFIATNTKITTSKTLKFFEEILDPQQFFRTHKSHLVNLKYVVSYIKGKGGYVVLSNGSKLEVAVRRKDLLLQKLKTI
ncbi:LytR/AlgR family response regulator transcription factor [Flagellimonas meridianipacifica]|uniref:Two-component system LytT family response regulator n=1 Tax=Flagellimonas meridianipacifica TaxID=1080225 RepID=A0A2T0M8Z8_9FLAO|nr:LytTR family DNA-binding domain-containing protein [Allomuricauda pacifica]PRX53948.1 two-component system LytT family response regulator [Allomuricauda pacifica]